MKMVDTYDRRSGEKCSEMGSSFAGFCKEENQRTAEQVGSSMPAIRKNMGWACQYLLENISFLWNEVQPRLLY